VGGTLLNMVVEQNLKQTTENYLEDSEYDDLNRSTMERIMSEFEKREDNEESEAGKLSRLQEVIPSVAAKDNVTHLDIILEAIRYIDSLQDKLADKIERGEIATLQVTGKRKRGEE